MVFRMVFVCSDCKTTFTARSSLYRHLRRQHDKEPRAIHPNSCQFCSKTFKTIYTLHRHVRRVHCNIPAPSNTQSCSSSSEDYTHPFSLSKTDANNPPLSTSHVSTPSNLLSHATPYTNSIPSTTSISDSPQISPHIAPSPPPSVTSPLSSKENLVGTPSKTGRIRCPVAPCSSVFSRYAYLNHHIKLYHDIAIDYEQLQFEKFEEFELWKSELEQMELAHYLPCTSGYNSKSDKTMYYDCHRSYIYKQKQIKRFRNPSIKTGKACPSRIICKIDHNGAVNVKFWKTHVGHNKQIKSISSLTPTNSGFDNQILERKMIKNANELRNMTNINTSEDMDHHNNDEKYLWAMQMDTTLQSYLKEAYKPGVNKKLFEKGVALIAMSLPSYKTTQQVNIKKIIETQRNNSRSK